MIEFSIHELSITFNTIVYSSFQIYIWVHRHDLSNLMANHSVIFLWETYTDYSEKGHISVKLSGNLTDHCFFVCTVWRCARLYHSYADKAWHHSNVYKNWRGRSCAPPISDPGSWIYRNKFNLTKQNSTRSSPCFTSMFFLRLSLSKTPPASTFKRCLHVKPKPKQNQNKTKTKPKLETNVPTSKTVLKQNQNKTKTILKLY